MSLVKSTVWSSKNHTHNSAKKTDTALLNINFFFIYKYNQILRDNYVKNTLFFFKYDFLNISNKAVFSLNQCMFRYIKYIIHNISNISNQAVPILRGEIL